MGYDEVPGSGTSDAPARERPDQSAPRGEAAGSAPTRVIAVVVAYNRRDLLVECLDALAAQTRPVDGILVIDNASTDDSAAVAGAHPAQPTVVTLPRNTGGAGGFAMGLAHAVGGMAADAVWVMDDDTIPTPTALAELLRACETYPGRVDVAGSRVVWTDGRDHPMNTPRVRPGVSSAQRRAAASVGALPIRSTSFVSMLISAAAVRRIGLPIADYFIWNDDFEYSTRVLRGRVGLHVRGSVVVHKTKTFGATDADPGDRFYYEVRNKLWMLLRSRSLSVFEKVVYGGSTLRRWIRTVARSKQRGVLWRAARRGARDGLRRPRPTDEVLAGLGVPELTPPPAAPSAGVASPATPASPAAPATGVATSTTGVDCLATRDSASPGSRLGMGAGSEPQPFSLLLPVYAGDRAEFLRRAFDSATAEQHRKPDEAIIVQDGPVDEAIAAELTAIEQRSTVPVHIVRLPTNRGLARALMAGLSECRHQIVARADADDISLPERFAVQVPVIEAGADLVGSALVEFATDESVTGVVRPMPTDPVEIASRARFADPFNHPTVVYRKDAVMAAGGYEHLHLMEDYLLFARMIARGAVVANVPDVLVKYRVGAGSYHRRGGRRLLAAEVALQRRLRAEGFVTRPQFMRNVAVRGGYRVVPEPVRRRVYRTLVVRDRGSGRATVAANPDAIPASQDSDSRVSGADR